MKRFLHGLFRLILLLILVGTGGLVMHYAMQGAEGWQEFIDCIADRRREGIAFGGGILIVTLLYIISGWGVGKPVDYLTFKGKSGVVSISIQTVTEYVARIADEFADVLSMEPRLRPDRKTVTVDLDVRVREGTQIPELTALLQDRVREAIRERVGLFDVKKVQVNIDEIVASGKPEPKPGEDLDAAITSSEDSPA